MLSFFVKEDMCIPQVNKSLRFSRATHVSLFRKFEKKGGINVVSNNVVIILLLSPQLLSKVKIIWTIFTFGFLDFFTLTYS